MGTYFALLRTPEQALRDLCEEEQGREQVRKEQRGQVYIA